MFSSLAQINVCLRFKCRPCIDWWMNKHARVCLVFLSRIYSQVHKYWDIDTILTFLALYTTTMDFKWNEQDVFLLQTVSFNLRVFTSKSGERCRNYNSLHMCLPLVKGPKVMGQLASQLFHGQVCVIPSLSQLQWADKRSRVHFKCAICIGICCCQLSRWDPKSCHYQWSKPSLGWKNKTNPSER